jgi:hypothetical protein
MGADCAQRSGADDPRRCQGTLDRRYVEDEETVPDWLAEEGVVIWIMVVDTVAVVPEAVLVTEKEADPAPPLTASISAWLSSIMTSIASLPNRNTRFRLSMGRLTASRTPSQTATLGGCPHRQSRQELLQFQDAI